MILDVRITAPPRWRLPERSAAQVTNVRDAAFDLFRAHGLTTIFGNPGSTELAFLADLPDDFDYLLGLHEGVVVAMADGYAQGTGSPALVSLHSAPGVAGAMGALVNAAAGRVPLVILAGQQARPLLTMGALLANPDPVTLPRPLVKWSFEPPRAQDVPAALARAIAAARQPPAGPVLVSLPMDDWDVDLDGWDRRTASRVVTCRHSPMPSAIRALAQRLAAARNPVLVVGAGVDSDGAWPTAVVLSERCQLPVYTAPLEPRCGFPTVHPAWQGTLPASQAGLRKALEGHDLVLVIGAEVFRYYLPDPSPLLSPGTELVLVTSDPEAAARAPIGDAVVGDVAMALRWLVAAVPASLRPDPPAGAKPTRPEPSRPMSAAAVYATLAAVRPEEAVLVAESPSSLHTCLDQVRFSRPGSFFAPAGASLGFALPAAIGLRLASPDRPVAAVVGDGALHYSAPALWTAAQRGVPVTVLVLRNEEYGVLKTYRDALGLGPVPGLDIAGLDNLALARGYGVSAERADTPEELAMALRQAMATSAPHLIEVPVAGASGDGVTLW
jgi:benzoylformate decarboxylase